MGETSNNNNYRGNHDNEIELGYPRGCDISLNFERPFGLDRDSIEEQGGQNLSPLTGEGLSIYFFLSLSMWVVGNTR